MSKNEWKRMAAEHAMQFVDDGMKLGLGTGSTAAYFVEALGKRVRGGLDVICVPTSEATRLQAESLGIPLTTLDDEPFLDLTVDGADEFDLQLRLIKGGGGALLREKIVATASDRMVVIADHTKKVEMLGAFALPVEVVPFGLRATLHMVELLAGDAGCAGDIRLRTGPDGQPFVTDSGHYILDCAFESIEDPEALAEALQIAPGVVDHGLFIGIADVALVGGPSGVEIIESSYGDDEGS